MRTLLPSTLDTMDRTSWLRERQKGVGGTDVTALMGLGYDDRDALAVYYEKTAEDIVDDPGKPIMRMGLATEEYNAECYSDRMGAALVRPGLVWADTFPWVFATFDRAARFESVVTGSPLHETRPVELKYSLFFDADEWGPDGSDLVPDGYLVQLHWQMLVLRSCGHTVLRGDISALSGAGEHRVYTVLFDERLANLLLGLSEAFWTFVTDRCEPIDWKHPLKTEIVNRLQSLRPDTSVRLDDKALAFVERMDVCKQLEKQAKDEGRACKEALQSVMDGAEWGSLPDGRRIHQHAVTRAAFTTPASTYVDFRILKAPKKGKRRAE